MQLKKSRVIYKHLDKIIFKCEPTCYRAWPWPTYLPIGYVLHVDLDESLVTFFVQAFDLYLTEGVGWVQGHHPFLPFCMPR